MSSASIYRRPRLSGPSLLRVRNFSGGLNLRDSENELDPIESPDAWNVTLDERGQVAKRLGYIKANPSVYNASKTTNGYYWAAGQNKITQSGTGLFKDDSTSAFKTFTTTARAGFADFQGQLFFIHPIDGLFRYDGATVTAVAGTGAPKGTTLAAWQNYLLASGDPNAKARVYRSKIADGTVWDTAAGAVTNDLREKDLEAVVCLAGASGIDISGRPGLIAFKNRSTYRIYDSSNLAYQTIDPTVGTASAISVASLFGRTYSLSERGIFSTDGVGKMIPASEREQPLFADTQIAFDQQDLWCAGFRGDRLYFSLCRAGSTANDLEFEYHPRQNWLVANSCAASFYTNYQKNAETLLAGSPTVTGQVYKRFVGGSDDGVAIASRFQTRWFEPNDGFLTRLRRARVIARGIFNLYTRFDYELGNRDLYSVSITGAAGIYDDPGSLYDTALYGPLKAEDYQDFQSLGCCKAVSFRVEETSTTSSTGPQILGGGTAPEIGAWALYGIDVSHIQLGTA